MPPRASAVPSTAASSCAASVTSSGSNGTGPLASSPASFRTSFSTRSPWKVSATRAPCASSPRAMAHAMLRLFATPITSARLPSTIPLTASPTFSG